MPSNYKTNNINFQHLLGSVQITIQFGNVTFEQIVDSNMQVIDHTRTAFIICVITHTWVVSLLGKSVRFGPFHVIPAVTRSNLVCYSHLLRLVHYELAAGNVKYTAMWLPLCSNQIATYVWIFNEICNEQVAMDSWSREDFIEWMFFYKKS